MNQSKLLLILKEKFGDMISFEPGESYYWAPKDKIVFYQKNDESEIGLWTLLHETSHGLENHTHYKSDFELVLLEVQAWEQAEKLSEEIGLKIDNDHIQDCLDSYRDWQYKRSLCPRCELGGIQITASTYKCMFCNDTWKVSAARFCRPYRRKAI
jgi:hypothetical protein